MIFTIDNMKLIDMADNNNQDEFNTQIDDESKALFLNAMKNVTPLKSKRKKVTIESNKQAYKKERVSSSKGNAPLKIDTNDLDPIGADVILANNKFSMSPKQFSQLKKGFLSNYRKLDLHQKTVKQAQLLLVKFVGECKENKVRYCCIIHGKGRGIIKAATAQFLNASSDVAAYHSAAPEDGGTGAVYVKLVF